MKYETLNELFFTAMETYRKPDALMHKSGGTWHRVSSKDFIEKARNLALGLRELGVSRGERIALLSENRLEWFFIDAALQMLGVVNVPIYATLPPTQVSYILRNSESKAIIVSTSAQQAKIASIRNELTAVEHFIAMDPPGASGLEAYRLGEIASQGAKKAETEPELHRRLASEIAPDDLATIIYTSGTTGDPKGVMLTHDNFVSNVKATLQALPPLTSADTALSALPYAHVFERLAAHYVFTAAGVTTAIAEGVDKIAENLTEIRPTVMTFAPRLYEKMHARVLENVSQSSSNRKKLFWWAVSVGREHGRYRMAGKTPPGLLELKYRLATALVFKKLQNRVGGRIRFFISGAAPLAPEIAEFFYAAGITILEGYGLTETSPVICVNRYDKIKFGTVGPTISGVEVKIAEDGEILVRGPNIMTGYYKNEAATGEALDPDGWFHTGDVGALDSDGYLSITDRKKDLIVTAGGKNIAPQPIENRIKTNAYIAEIVLVGNRRKFPSALVVPDFEKLGQWAESQDVATRDREELVNDPKVLDFMQQQIDEMTSGLAQFEKIKQIRLLAAEFTVDGGELTPTLKVKRRVIESRYKDIIDKMYT
jgi:long-chain acyl-CoA synthetase